MNPSASPAQPASSTLPVEPGAYVSADGRPFSALSPQEQDLVVNGPRISLMYVVLALILWAADLGFLFVLARPYMKF